MRLVSAIIVINLAYVSCIGWNTFLPRKEVHHDVLRDAPGSIYPNVTRRVIWQPTDHFDPNENRTFKAWYDQSLDFWKPNGPIYMWILQETFPSDEDRYVSNNTLIYALAQETNGAMFVSQVRYCGESIPHDHKSDNYYKYLSTTQQLADIAGLIKYLKSKPEFQSSKVVLLGCERAANLATWMRLEHPDLVDAAVASSAPLLAKKEASEINEYTAYLYDHYGYKGCLNDIEERFEAFKYALKNATELELYKIKHDIYEDNNFTVIEDQQMYMVLQHGQYRFFPNEGYLGGIKDCKYFAIGGLKADFHYDRYIKIIKKHFYKYFADYYQSCLEYGQFETASEKKPPFDDFVTLDFFVKRCKDLFGIDEKRMDEGIAQTNLMYGGLTPNVTNVIFTQGDLNPYKVLGVQQNLSDLAPAFDLKYGGYLNIMYIGYIGYVDEDRAEKINHVKTLIKKWIGL